MEPPTLPPCMESVEIKLICYDFISNRLTTTICQGSTHKRQLLELRTKQSSLSPSWEATQNQLTSLVRSPTRNTFTMRSSMLMRCPNKMKNFLRSCRLDLALLTLESIVFQWWRTTQTDHQKQHTRDPSHLLATPSLGHHPVRPCQSTSPTSHTGHIITSHTGRTTPTPVRGRAREARTVVSPAGAVGREDIAMTKWQDSQTTILSETCMLLNDQSTTTGGVVSGWIYKTLPWELACLMVKDEEVAVTQVCCSQWERTAESKEITRLRWVQAKPEYP